MNQNQIHFSSLSSSNLASFSRNHPSRSQGPGGSASHTAPAAMARSLREERCEAIVNNAKGFPYSRWFYPLYINLVAAVSPSCFIWCLTLYHLVLFWINTIYAALPCFLLPVKFLMEHLLVRHIQETSSSQLMRECSYVLLWRRKISCKRRRWYVVQAHAFAYTKWPFHINNPPWFFPLPKLKYLSCHLILSHLSKLKNKNL